MSRPAQGLLRSVVVGALVAGALIVAEPIIAPRPSSADTVSDTLLGEGGSFAEPIVNKLLSDAASQTAPFSLSYFDANLDQGRSDFAAGNADFDVTELPISATDAATAKANGRSFAYVPFAASPVAIGAVVECSTTPTLLPTTMCPNLQVTIPQLADLMTFAINFWNDPQLSTISGGTEAITPVVGRTVVPEVEVDPSAATYALIALFDSDPTAKPIWDSFLAGLKLTGGDAPIETWPNQTGIHGGDSDVAQSLVPENPSTLLPYPNPTTWGVGQLAPIPTDWIGPPRNIPTIALQNAAGAFVSPTVAAGTAALNDATLDSSTNLVTFQNSASDKAAYPLMVMSYLVVPTTGLPVPKAAALAALIRFALGTQGQADVSGLGAAPVTPAMVTAGLAVANQVAAEGSFSVTVNGSSSATVNAGATATLAESGLSSTATGTVAFTSGSTSLCTITLPATSCTTPATLAPGAYGNISASYLDGSGDPAVAATNTLSLTVSAASTTTTSSTTTTTTTTAATTTGNGSSSVSDESSSTGGSSGALAFTGANVLPLSVIGGAMIGVAAYCRRRLRRRMVE